MGQRLYVHHVGVKQVGVL